MAQPITVRVRLAVVVDENGYWSAAGNCIYEADQDVIDAANDYMPVESSLTRHVVWLEADVPVP